MQIQLAHVSYFLFFIFLGSSEHRECDPDSFYGSRQNSWISSHQNDSIKECMNVILFVKWLKIEWIWLIVYGIRCDTQRAGRWQIHTLCFIIWTFVISISASNDDSFKWCEYWNYSKPVFFSSLYQLNILEWKNSPISIRIYALLMTKLLTSMLSYFQSFIFLLFHSTFLI